MNFQSSFRPPGRRTPGLLGVAAGPQHLAAERPEARMETVDRVSGQDASPQYSPSGDKICFRSDRSGEEQLWVSKPDGSEPTQITRGAMRPSVGRGLRTAHPWSSTVPKRGRSGSRNSRTRVVGSQYGRSGGASRVLARRTLDLCRRALRDRPVHSGRYIGRKHHHHQERSVGPVRRTAGTCISCVSPQIPRCGGWIWIPKWRPRFSTDSFQRDQLLGVG